MRTFLVVVGNVLPKDSPEVPFAEDKDVVQTLMAHGEGYIYPDWRRESE